MASLPPSHPLSDALTRVDRAVSRLARIHSSLHPHPPPRPHRPPLPLQELSSPHAHNHGKGSRRQSSMADKPASPSARPRQHSSNKENVGAKKKRRKITTPSLVVVQDDGLGRAPDDSAAVAMAKSRPALKNKPLNVVSGVARNSVFHPTKDPVVESENLSSSAIDSESNPVIVPFDVNGGSGTLEQKPENGADGVRPKFPGTDIRCQWRRSTFSESSSNIETRPPWRNFTTIPNNPLAATIAERVMATDGSQTIPVTGKKKKKTQVTKAGQKNAENEEDELEVGRGGIATADNSERPFAGIDMDAAMTMAGAQTSGENSKGVLAKAFCVDVRPNPNRPWRLTTKSSCSAKPLIMFPNPTFKASTATGNGGSETACRKSIPSGPKLAPFKSFQLRPSNRDRPLFERPMPSATIRTYMSPSKTSPRQSTQADDVVKKNAGLSMPFTIHPNDRSACVAAISEKNPPKAIKQKDNCWLRRRFSLPCASSSRFSVLSWPHKSEEFEAAEFKPSPSLIPGMPLRKSKRTSIESLLGSGSRSPPTPPRSTAVATTAASGAQIERVACPLPLHRVRRSTAKRADNEEESVMQQSARIQKAMEEGLMDRRKRRSSEGRAKGFKQEEVEALERKGEGEEEARRSPRSWTSSLRQGRHVQKNSKACAAVSEKNRCAGAGPYILKQVKEWMHPNPK